MSADLQRPRALVIDDWPSNRRVLTWILERAGYRVDGAVSGPHALNALQRNNYDLVVTDLFLGEGWEGSGTVKRLREAAPTAKIVAVSTDSSTQIAREIEEQQVDLVSRAHAQAYFLDMAIPLEERIALAVNQAIDAKLRPIMAKAEMLKSDGSIDLDAIGEAIARFSTRRRLMSDWLDVARKRSLQVSVAVMFAAVALAAQWVWSHFLSDIGQVVGKGKGPP